MVDSERFATHAKEIILASLLHVVFWGKKNPPLGRVRLGSKYGGWDVLDDPSLSGATLISCGLGEDASFDIEFARKFGALVIFVDPTPRAVEHFLKLAERCGLRSRRSYSDSGNQSVEAYDLGDVPRDKLFLVQKAISNEDGHAEFFLPEDPTFVSHSLVSPRLKDISEARGAILVQTLSPKSLLREVPSGRFDVLKMDIEGTELIVLEGFLSQDNLPKQILVEFDFARSPTLKSLRDFLVLTFRMRRRGYSLFSIDKLCASFCRL